MCKDMSPTVRRPHRDRYSAQHPALTPFFVSPCFPPPRLSRNGNRFLSRSRWPRVANVVPVRRADFNFMQFSFRSPMQAILPVAPANDLLYWTIARDDAHVTCGILCIVLVWLGLWQQLCASGIVTSTATRKAIHISCGPAFIALWPLYSDEPTARLAAAIVPLLFGFVLILSGLAKQSDSRRAALGRALSRSGNPHDALEGPLYYTIILLALTLFCFKNVISAIAIMQLCFGDGFAELAGRRFGAKCKWPWQWTGNKSVAGSLAFTVTAFVASVAAVAWFQHCKVSQLVPEDMYTLSALAFISIACAVVEIAPASVVGDDNIAISATAVFLSTLLFTGKGI